MNSRSTSLKYSPFVEMTGGLCDAQDPINIPDGCLQACSDAFVDVELKKRPGRVKYGAATGTTVRGVYEFADSIGARRIIAVAGGKIYEVTGAALTEVATITDEVVTFASTAGVCYISGATVAKRVERTSSVTATLIVSAVGLSSPATSPTLSAISGALTGLYSYVVTYVIERDGALWQESNPCPVGTALSVTAQGVRLSAVPVSADSRVTARRVYRTTADGSKFYYLGQISNNTATTYDDAGTTVDTVLQAEVAYNHGTPYQALDIEVCNSRAFAAVDNLLRWSQIGRPAVPYLEYWQALDYHTLPAKITALRKLYNVGTGVEDLFIFTAGGIYALPAGDQSATPQRVRDDMGCSAPDSICEYNGRLVFLSSRGTIESLSPAGSVDISTLRIPKAVGQITDHVSARGTMWGHYYLLSARTSNSVAYSTRTYCCDLRTLYAKTSTSATAVWHLWGTQVDWWLSTAVGLLAVSAVDGQVFKYALESLDDQLTDGSYLPIPFSVRSKDLFGDSLFVKKRPCRLNIKGNCTQPISVTPYYSAGPTSTSAATEAIQGKSVFIAGTSKAGDRVTQRGSLLEAALSADCTGETFSFQFAQEGKDSGMSITGYQFTYISYSRGL